ncbi:hypothetical protein EDC15_11170 [Acetobacter aceti NBRC 14818]|nr:hypothetical protein EDC15_11170 [Acetobacter aceti NBRC 14818]
MHIACLGKRSTAKRMSHMKAKAIVFATIVMSLKTFKRFDLI